MTKTIAKKVAAKNPAKAAKKAAQKKLPPPKKLTKEARTEQAAKNSAAIANVSLRSGAPAHKPTKEQRKAAQQTKKLASLRRRKLLPPTNPKAGQLTGKAKPLSKGAQKAAQNVQATIPAPRTKPDPEAKVRKVKQQGTDAAASIKEELKPTFSMTKPSANTVAKPNILPAPPKDQPYVGVTHHRETCIVISRGARVRFIPFTSQGLYILTQEAHALDMEYQPTDYPVARAAKLYHEASKFFECADNAREALAQLAGIVAPAKQPAPVVPTDGSISQEFPMSTQAAAKKSGSVKKLDVKAPKKAAAKKTKEPAEGRVSSYAGKKIQALVKPTEHGARDGTTRAERRTAVLKCKTTDAALAVPGVDATVLNNMVKLKLIKIV